MQAEKKTISDIQDINQGIQTSKVKQSLAAMSQVNISATSISNVSLVRHPVQCRLGVLRFSPGTQVRTFVPEVTRITMTPIPWTILLG